MKAVDAIKNLLRSGSFDWYQVHGDRSLHPPARELIANPGGAGLLVDRVPQ
jgi:hypothetical protein